MRVQVDPEQAAARNLSLNDIRDSVARANSNVPVGTMQGPRQNITIQATGQMEKAEDYRNVVVAYRNGQAIKLEEVARLYNSVENDKVAGWYNGERAIILAIQRQPDANTVAVVDEVRNRMPSYLAFVPPTIDIKFLNDRSISIVKRWTMCSSRLLCPLPLWCW